jgi:hypothetical protein
VLQGALAAQLLAAFANATPDWHLLAPVSTQQSLQPEEYPSSLPVHMDGSCNGLQHYAALGRDEAGGRAVNLLPADAPQVRVCVGGGVWSGLGTGWRAAAARWACLA